MKKRGRLHNKLNYPQERLANKLVNLHKRNEQLRKLNINKNLLDSF